MRTATLPLSPDDQLYIVCVPIGDGTATLYEAGDDLPPSMIPSPPSIQAISARQIRLALNQAGLRDAVEATVAAGPRGLRDWWEYSVEIHRAHPMVAAMIAAIGATPEQADEVWRLGAGL